MLDAKLLEYGTEKDCPKERCKSPVVIKNTNNSVLLMKWLNKEFLATNQQAQPVFVLGNLTGFLHKRFRTKSNTCTQRQPSGWVFPNF